MDSTGNMQSRQSRAVSNQRDLDILLDRLNDPQLDSRAKGNLLEQCEHVLSAMMDQMQALSSSIPANDKRNYMNAIKVQSERLRKARKSLAPKRKFEFKPSARNADNEAFTTRPSIPDAEGRVAGPASSTLRSGSRTAGDCDSADWARNSQDPSRKVETPGLLTNISSSAGTRITSMVGTYHIPCLEGMEDSSVLLSDIRRSVVDLSLASTQQPLFASITIKNVINSLLLCGTASGAAHLTRISSSTVVLRSRQVRIHASTDCVLYLHCSSHPIIEDCSNIRFAPLPAILGGDDRSTSNMWDQIDDFDWLRAGQSPNWHLLPPDDPRAVTDETWNTVVDRAPSADKANMVLRQASIQT